jgi:hypothetical protein
MNEPNNIFPDPLDAMLPPRAPSEADEPLRRRLLERTTRALRRRRRVRFVAWATALAACYAAGMVTMHWLAPRQSSTVEIVKSPPAPAAASVPPPAPPPPPDAAPTSAVALEWKAFDADKPRPDLYRQAADQYRRADDPASALRCYGQSLNGASDKDLAISPDDDYLLMIVKEARQKEKIDAKKHG